MTESETTRHFVDSLIAEHLQHPTPLRTRLIALVVERDRERDEELRAPGPCGKHSRLFWKVDMQIEAVSEGLGDELLTTQQRRCAICAEIEAAEEAGYERGWSDSHEPVSTLRDGKGALAEHVAERIAAAVKEMRERCAQSVDKRAAQWQNVDIRAELINEALTIRALSLDAAPKAGGGQ